ncbi:unnamed protein product [Caenorhabditis auriculariae]|uniref:Nucleolar complex protein 2 homolog n=1 Tax=Caenorhabditis auriculariae TaxID=2777116 RepID=A0A8S1HR48_9PELO|nr:unnamed protein product [Caenorhabditis auriculariae]
MILNFAKDKKAYKTGRGVSVSDGVSPRRIRESLNRILRDFLRKSIEFRRAFRFISKLYLSFDFSERNMKVKAGKTAKSPKLKSREKKKPVIKEVDVEEAKEEDSLGGSEESDFEDEDTLETFSKHKLDLEKLKETDPEFFKFLQEEDADLLNVEGDEENEEEEEEDVDDDEEESDVEELDGEKDVKPERKPKAKQDSASGRLIVDGNIIEYLQNKLDFDTEKEDVSLDASAVRMAVDVFIACVARVGADLEAPKYIIQEQSVFDESVRLCFLALPTAFQKLLSTSKGEDESTKVSRPKLKKHQNMLRTYLQAVLIFLNEIQTPAVIASTLKSIMRLVDFYAHFAKLTRQLIKSLTRVWSRKTIECRVVAFVCMSRLVKDYPQHFSALYKNAYVAFVSNSKVVTNETWPLLQFMHRTYAELTLQNPGQAYRFAFVYIRQTAVHLRNAMIGKGRKDLVYSVYNWQMIQCIYLWVRVVAKAHSVTGAESIAELVYPLVQVIIGMFRLSNAPTFLPLRFHCCQLLIQLQASCATFIPVLRYATEALEELGRELKRKPSVGKTVTKIPDIECTLRISSQYSDTPQWRKAACEYIFRTMMQGAHLLASQAGFPDVIVPVNHAISSLLSELKNADYAQLFRGLQSKLREHSKYIQDILKKKEIRLNDEVQVLAIRFHLNSPDSPLRAYYRQWEHVWKMKHQALTQSSQAESKVDEKKNAKKRKAVENANKKEMEKEEEVIGAPKKRKKATPAAKKADASIADTFADLSAWSDEES